MRRDVPAAIAARDKARGKHPRWHRPTDAGVAYAPWLAGLTVGIAGVLDSSSKTVAITGVVATMSTGAIGTYWSRYKKKREQRRHADR